MHNIPTRYLLYALKEIGISYWKWEKKGRYTTIQIQLGLSLVPLLTTRHWTYLAFQKQLSAMPWVHTSVCLMDSGDMRKAQQRKCLGRKLISRSVRFNMSVLSGADVMKPGWILDGWMLLLQFFFFFLFLSLLYFSESVKGGIMHINKDILLSSSSPHRL